MRLFFALWPDPVLQSELAAWGRLCHAACGGRVQQADKLHATLAFLGEIEVDRYAALCSIADTIRAPAFELTLNRIGYWRHNRIVYAAVTETPRALTELAHSLAVRLAAAGFRTEQRDYVPHVTLLRDARRAPVDVNPAPLSWRVGALTLVETLRREQKLRYQKLQCWTLAD